MSKVPNRHRGEVLVVVEEKEYLMIPTMRTVSSIEETIGSLSMFARSLSVGDFKVSQIASIVSLSTIADGGPSYKEMYEVCLAKGSNGFIEPVAEFLASCLGGTENASKINEEEEENPPSVSSEVR